MSPARVPTCRCDRDRARLRAPCRLVRQRALRPAIRQGRLFWKGEVLGLLGVDIADGFRRCQPWLGKYHWLARRGTLKLWRLK